MELSQAVQRVVRVRFGWLASFILLGILGAVAAHFLLHRDVPTYTASTRLAMDSRTQSVSDSTALADQARAVVTSRSHVAAALKQAGADRDPVSFGRNDVRVSSLGTSNVIDISVTDVDPSIAAAVANELAADLVKTRAGLSQTDPSGVVANIDNEIKTRDSEIAALDARIADLSRPEANVGGRNDQTLNLLSARRTGLASERLALLTKRYDLVSAAATQSSPTVVDRAVPPSRADPSPLPGELGIGLVVGLLLGVAMAALLETLRPTLIGAAAVSRATGAPVLEHLKAPPHYLGIFDAGELAGRLKLAASVHGLQDVGLVSVGPATDLPSVAESISLALRHNGTKTSFGHTDPVRLGVFDSAGDFSDGTAKQAGVVAVVPSVVKRSELRHLEDLLALSRWPLLGVIVYDLRRRRAARRAARRTAAMASPAPSSGEAAPGRARAAANGGASALPDPVLRAGRVEGD